MGIMPAKELGPILGKTVAMKLKPAIIFWLMLLGRTAGENFKNYCQFLNYISYLLIHFNASHFVSVTANMPVMELLLLMVLLAVVSGEFDHVI